MLMLPAFGRAPALLVSSCCVAGHVSYCYSETHSDVVGLQKRSRRPASIG